MIKLILLDVFGTIIVPRRAIHIQYAEIARSYGLIVEDDAVKSGFKAAYGHFAKLYPLYGKHANPPLDPFRWWTLVIEKTFEEAGCPGSDLQTTLPLLGPALIEHFWSNKAYKLHDDVLPFLRSWRNLPSPPTIGCVSNSDSRMHKVLESLEVIPQFIPANNFVTSWDCDCAKPDKRVFEKALARLGGQSEIQPSEVLFIGDDYKEDFEGATNAGMQAALLVRPGQEASHPHLSDSTDLSKEHVFKSLEDAIPFIQKQDG